MSNWLGLEAVVHDTRYATRAVRKDWRYFAFAVAIVAIGVAASATVFSLAQPLMLRPLPFMEPGQLIWIANDGEGDGMSAVTSRTSNLTDFRSMASSFDGITGYNAFFQADVYNYIGSSGPRRLTGAGVAHDFLDVLGVQPQLGRNFTAEEGTSDGPLAIILSHAFWVAQFNSDPAIVGTDIIINEMPRLVVGVLPSSFDFASLFTPTARVDFLRTFPIDERTDRWGNTLAMIGRLDRQASVEAVQAELDAIVVGLQEAEPDRWGLGARVSTLRHHLAGPHTRAMLLLAGAAAIVMLIVCVNLSNLLLARAPRRTREMAIRAALGASRRRLIRQMVLESLIASASGAAAGILIAHQLTESVVRRASVSIPLLDTVTVDGVAILFAAGLAIAVGVVVGVFPALQVSDGGSQQGLTGSRSATVGRRARSLREGLVVAEIAMACVLLVVGGLLLRSLQEVLTAERGFESSGLVAWDVGPARDFGTYGDEAAFFEQLVEAVSAFPGVEAVGLVDSAPLGRNRSWSINIPGGLPEEDPEVHPHLVNDTYLQTLGIELKAGRFFNSDDMTIGLSARADRFMTEEERPESGLVAIINETAAQALFPGQDPIGQYVNTGPDWEIVGVVADMRHRTLEDAAGLQLYMPFAQNPDHDGLSMLVRSDLPVATLRVQVEAAMQAADPGMPTGDFETLDDVISRTTSPRRFTLALLGGFAVAALLLAIVGIYAVLSYGVAEQTREIGIRMALGETAQQVRLRIVKRTLLLASIGVGVGCLVALAASTAAQSQLYEVGAGDPLTLGAVATMLVLAALAAGLGPAIRASRTSSIRALETP